MAEHPRPAAQTHAGQEALERGVPLPDGQEAELLFQMAGIYPGDIAGSLSRDACQLLGIPYEPGELIITTGDPTHG